MEIRFVDTKTYFLFHDMIYGEDFYVGAMTITEAIDYVDRRWSMAYSVDDGVGEEEAEDSGLRIYDVYYDV